MCQERKRAAIKNEKNDSSVEFFSWLFSVLVQHEKPNNCKNQGDQGIIGSISIKATAAGDRLLPSHYLRLYLWFERGIDYSVSLPKKVHGEAHGVVGCDVKGVLDRN